MKITLSKSRFKVCWKCGGKGQVADRHLGLKTCWPCAGEGFNKWQIRQEQGVLAADAAHVLLRYLVARQLTENV